MNHDMDQENRNNLKRNPFTVPDGYFENLESDIRRRTSTVAPADRLKLQQLWPGLAIAASIALAVLIFRPSDKPLASEQILAEISDDQLSSYVAEIELLEREDILQPSEELEWNDAALILDSL